MRVVLFMYTAPQFYFKYFKIKRAISQDILNYMNRTYPLRTLSVALNTKTLNGDM